MMTERNRHSSVRTVQRDPEMLRLCIGWVLNPCLMKVSQCTKSMNMDPMKLFWWSKSSSLKSLIAIKFLMVHGQWKVLRLVVDLPSLRRFQRLLSYFLVLSEDGLGITWSVSFFPLQCKYTIKNRHHQEGNFYKYEVQRSEYVMFGQREVEQWLGSRVRRRQSSRCFFAGIGFEH